MPDFEIIHSALKVTWIRRMYENGEKANRCRIPLHFLKCVGGSFLWDKEHNYFDEL